MSRAGDLEVPRRFVHWSVRGPYRVRVGGLGGLRLSWLDCITCALAATRDTEVQLLFPHAIRSPRQSLLRRQSELVQVGGDVSGQHGLAQFFELVSDTVLVFREVRPKPEPNYRRSDRVDRERRPPLGLVTLPVQQVDDRGRGMAGLMQLPDVDRHLVDGRQALHIRDYSLAKTTGGAGHTRFAPGAAAAMGGLDGVQIVGDRLDRLARHDLVSDTLVDLTGNWLSPSALYTICALTA